MGFKIVILRYEKFRAVFALKRAALVEHLLGKARAEVNRKQAEIYYRKGEKHCLGHEIRPILTAQKVNGGTAKQKNEERHVEKHTNAAPPDFLKRVLKRGKKDEQTGNEENIKIRKHSAYRKHPDGRYDSTAAQSLKGSLASSPNRSFYLPHLLLKFCFYLLINILLA